MLVNKKGINYSDACLSGGPDDMVSARKEYGIAMAEALSKGGKAALDTWQ